jgi:glycosyltransferase involved in cell wall biosynthesis
MQSLRVQVLDPSAFGPNYDHQLCGALARAGAQVELVTGPFRYGSVPREPGYAVREPFYRLAARAGAGSPAGRVAKLVEHVPEMLRWRRTARAQADVVHAQWLPIQGLDPLLLPRDVPLVFTAHELMPREPSPAGDWGRRKLYERADAIVVHTESGRDRLVGELGVPTDKVEVIPHGAFDYLVGQPGEQALPPELAAVQGKVVLCLGVWRPYHGIDVLLKAWQGIDGAELWVVGLPKMPTEELERLAAASPSVRMVPRFITDPELPAWFRRADLVVMPYRHIEASGVLFSVLPFGRALLATDVGAFADIGRQGGAELVPPEDPAALHDALVRLLGDDAERERLGAAAARLAEHEYAWDTIGEQTVDLYRRVLARRAAGGGPR